MQQLIAHKYQLQHKDLAVFTILPREGENLPIAVVVNSIQFAGPPPSPSAHRPVQGRGVSRRRLNRRPQPPHRRRALKRLPRADLLCVGPDSSLEVLNLNWKAPGKDSVTDDVTKSLRKLEFKHKIRLAHSILIPPTLKVSHGEDRSRGGLGSEPAQRSMVASRVLTGPPPATAAHPRPRGLVPCPPAGGGEEVLPSDGGDPKVFRAPRGAGGG